jgi:hypothetical protein
MKGRDVSQPMPDNSEPDTPVDEALESLLAGQVHVPAELRGLADVLASLAAPGTASELTGEAAALVAFREATRKEVPGKSMRTRLTVVAILGALGFGGATAAAYAGVLPESAQNLAHQAIGAPPPPPPREPSTPVAEPEASEAPTPTRSHSPKPSRGESTPPVKVEPSPTPTPSVKAPSPGRPAEDRGKRPTNPGPPEWSNKHKVHHPHPKHPHGEPPKGRPSGKPIPPGQR